MHTSSGAPDPPSSPRAAKPETQRRRLRLAPTGLHPKDVEFRSRPRPREPRGEVRLRLGC
eukprot:5324325-Prymnesium_polylepis.1